MGQSIPNRPNLAAREIPICLKFSTYLENNNNKIFPEGFFYTNSLFFAGMQSFVVGNVEKAREFNSDNSIRVFYKDYQAICFKLLLLYC